MRSDASDNVSRFECIVTYLCEVHVGCEDNVISNHGLAVQIRTILDILHAHDSMNVFL